MNTAYKIVWYKIIYNKIVLICFSILNLLHSKSPSLRPEFQCSRIPVLYMILPLFSLLKHCKLEVKKAKWNANALLSFFSTLSSSTFSFELQVIREREKELSNRALSYLKASKAQMKGALTFLLSYQMKILPLLFNFSCNFCLKESVSLFI